MGLTTSTLDIKIKADTSGLKQGAREAREAVRDLGDESERSSGKLKGLDSESLLAGSSLVNMANAAINAFGQIKNAVGSYIEAGSDAIETQNVVNVAFGDAVDMVNEWSSSMVDSFGLGATEAKNFAGTFKVMGSSMGLAESSASDMSMALAELAADMGSFYNASAADTFQALQGIYTGSTESLRKYGIVINQATQEQWMLEHGINASYTELSEAEKVAIRYGAVMEATAAAQGDFTRSTGSWSNETKKLASYWQEIKETIGNALAGVLLPFVEIFNKLLQGISTLLKTASQYEYYTLDDGTPMLREKAAAEDEAPIAGTIDIAESYSQMAEAAYKEAEKTRLALEAAGNSADGVGDAIDRATAKVNNAASATRDAGKAITDTDKAVNQIKRDVMGFDELNKLSDNSSFGGFASVDVDGVTSANEAIAKLKNSWASLKDAIKSAPKYEAFVDAMGNVKTAINVAKEKISPFTTAFNKMKDKLAGSIGKTFGKTPIGAALSALKTAAGTTAVNAIGKLQNKLGGLTFGGKAFADTKLGKCLDGLKNKITGSGGSNDALNAAAASIKSLKEKGLMTAAAAKDTKFGKLLSGITSGLTSANNATKKSIKSLQEYYDKINSAPKVSAGTIINDISKGPTVYTPTAYASGGYPAQGSMFIAGEAGPEFVGSVGGKTGVWNSDQLISGIYEAMRSALASAGINATINLDGRQVYKNVVRNANANRFATGATGFVL